VEDLCDNQALILSFHSLFLHFSPLHGLSANYESVEELCDNQKAIVDARGAQLQRLSDEATHAVTLLKDMRAQVSPRIAFRCSQTPVCVFVSFALFTLIFTTLIHNLSPTRNR
jgi:hypothetical protein